MLGFSHLVDDLKGKSNEGEAPVDTLLRLLESGEMTLGDLERIRGLGKKGVRFISDFLELKTKTTMVSASTRLRQ